MMSKFIQFTLLFVVYVAVVASTSDLVAEMSDTALDNIVPEMDMAEIVPMQELEPTLDMVQEALQTALARVSPVTEAIVALKSYCLGANSLLDSVDKSTIGDTSSSLVRLIQNFGKEVKKGGDIVDEFADVILGLRSESVGLTDYFIKNVNMAVLKGTSPVKAYQKPDGDAGYVVSFGAEVVGLDDLPSVYIDVLGVPLEKWGQLKTEIEADVSQSWDPVKEKWQLSKIDSQHAYDEAYDRLKNKWGLDNQLIDQMAEARGQVAIHTAYNVGKRDNASEVDILRPLPPAGTSESADYREKHPNPLSEEEVVSSAKDAAAKTMKQRQREGPSDAALLKKVEETKAGLTLRLTTGEGTRDISSQQPGIQLIREKGVVDETIETLPMRGESLTKTFTGKLLGKLLGVRLLAQEGDAGADGWHIAKMEAQDGFGKNWQTMVPVTCDGPYRENVWLNSVGNSVANFSYTAHLGGSSHVEGNEHNVAAATHASGAAADGAPKWSFIPKGTPVIPCVQYKKAEPTEKCSESCSFKGDTKIGKVWCEEVESGNEVTDDKCEFWEHAKPAALRKVCPATPTCVQWQAQPASTNCVSTCGYAGTINSGDVFCRETKSHSRVDEQSCTFNGYGTSKAGNKPAPLTHRCPPTVSCFHYRTIAPSGTCPTGCGNGASTLHGQTVCDDTRGGMASSLSLCSWQAAPATPTRSCAATGCCLVAYGACVHGGGHNAFGVRYDDPGCGRGSAGNCNGMMNRWSERPCSWRNYGNRCA